MKARVKATEEIIELSDLEYDVDGNDYLRTELEITDDPDYWEKLKHQYAGMAMQSLIIKDCSIKEMIETSSEIATALVNRLKEDSQCEK